jgi:hypothetical protein
MPQRELQVKLISQNDLFIDMKPERCECKFALERTSGAFSRAELELFASESARKPGRRRTNPGKAALASKRVGVRPLAARPSSPVAIALSWPRVRGDLDEGRALFGAKHEAVFLK